MSSYSSAKALLSSMRENPYKKQLTNTLLTLSVSALLITNGIFLYQAQDELKGVDNSKYDQFRWGAGILQLILGILLVLYIIYSFFSS